MENALSIMLVDDHTIVRNGLKSLIQVLGNYKITHEFENGWEFIKAIPQLPEADLVIMDMNMPEMNGLETMRWLKAHKPTMRVLMLTLSTDEQAIVELFRYGVRGYLPKNCTAAALKKAIDDTVNTGYYHNEILQNALAAGTGKTLDDKTILERITDRELLFIKLICDEREYTYDQIKEIMGVHRRTVDGYREALFDKFSIKSKTGVVLFAIKHGLVEI
jgi:two-component system invasion response regulator UvrY